MPRFRTFNSEHPSVLLFLSAINVSRDAVPYRHVFPGHVGVVICIEIEAKIIIKLFGKVLFLNSMNFLTRFYFKLRSSNRGSFSKKPSVILTFLLFLSY